jgi:cardiolipin synthase
MYKLYFKGEASFNRLFELINEAKESIYINMFIWRDDVIGNILLKHLLNAADRGVKVIVKKDRLGQIFEISEENRQSMFHKDTTFLEKSKALPIYLVYPMPNKSKSGKQKASELAKRFINHKNVNINTNEYRNDHSKYYIFDNEIIFLGGINVEDKEIYVDSRDVSYFDYMIEINGIEEVNHFNKAFKFGLDKNRSISYFFNNSNGFNAKFEMLSLINNATESIIFVMAYFGDKDIIQSIKDAINRGVDIQMYVPSNANIQNDLNLSIIKDLFDSTNKKIDLYLCEKMIHAKILIIDKKIITLGSTNLNYGAMTKLFECNVVLNEPNEDFINNLFDTINEIKNNSIRIDNTDNIVFCRIKAYLERVF